MGEANVCGDVASSGRLVTVRGFKLPSQFSVPNVKYPPWLPMTSALPSPLRSSDLSMLSTSEGLSMLLSHDVPSSAMLVGHVRGSTYRVLMPVEANRSYTCSRLPSPS